MYSPSLRKKTKKHPSNNSLALPNGHDEHPNIKNSPTGKNNDKIDSKKTKTKVVSIDENMEETLNCRQKVDRFLSTNNRLFYIKLVVNIISGLSFLYYILCTYIHILYTSLNYIDYGICLLYIIEHIIDLILAHHGFYYLISVNSIVNLVTEIPPLFSLLCSDFFLDSFYRFINITRVIRLLRVFRLMQYIQSGEKDVKKQIFNIVITLLTVIFIWAGVIEMLELGEVEVSLTTTWDVLGRNNLLLRQHYHHYLYFIIVTMTTVGYGEIVPSTLLGRLMIMLLVVVILLVVPDQTNELIQLVGIQSLYARRSYKATSDVFHIVLLGDIDLDSLKSFCTEFFHQDHGSQYKHAVIIKNEAPSKEMEIYLNEKAHSNFLIYIQGDPMNDEDLLRCDIIRARACVIFTNKNSLDPYSGDHQSLLLGLYVKKFYFNAYQELKKTTPLPDRTVFRICMQLNKPESSTHYFNTLQSNYKKKMPLDQLLVIEAMKMNLMSKSCLTPGIVALLSNLVMSSGNILEGNEPEWLKEYSEGREHEIYRVNLEGELLHKTFSEIAIGLYEEYQAIPLTLEIEQNGVSIVKLNPQSIRPNDKSNEPKVDLTILQILQMNSSLNDSTKDLIDNRPSHNKKLPKASIYMICSDKEVADQITQREQETSLLSKKSFIPHPTTFKPDESGTFLKARPQYRRVDSIAKEDETEVEEDNADKDQEEDYSNYHTIANFGNDNRAVEIMHQSIKDRDDIFNHVIICGIHPEIKHFILPLRAKYIPEKQLKWIVILAPSLPQELHNAFSIFPKIIFIQGSPLQPENLFRANISSADIAVILSSGYSKAPTSIDETTNKTSDEEEMLDAETIFIYKAIKKINKNIKIMTELIVTKNIEFLLNATTLEKLYVKAGSDPLYEYTSVFASGEVYLPSVVDKITCQTFYNQNLLNFFNLILSGENKNKTKAVTKMENCFQLMGSNLFLVPNDSHNESFNDMFNRLVKKHHAVPIALYRQTVGDTSYYIYTNPKKTTLIRDTDLVFILSSTEDMEELLEKRKDAFNDQVVYEDEKEETNKTTTNFLQLFESQINKIEDDKKEDSNENDNKKNESLSTKRSEARKASTRDDKGIEKTNFMKGLTNKKNESSKHTEIDELQKSLDKSLKNLTGLKTRCDDILNGIHTMVKNEITYELFIYIARNDKGNA